MPSLSAMLRIAKDVNLVVCGILLVESLLFFIKEAFEHPTPIASPDRQPSNDLAGFRQRGVAHSDLTPSGHPAAEQLPSADHVSKLLLRKTEYPAECRELIANRKAPGPQTKNTLSSHAARSIPNDRLVQAFQIYSCFTSSDQMMCKGFREKLETVLYISDDKWKQFAATARTTAHTLFGTNVGILICSKSSSSVR